VHDDDPPSGGADPHTPAVPPPPQVCPAAQVQFAVSPPHPSLCCPHRPTNEEHVIGMHAPPSGAPHCPETPAPPHVCPAGHVPQFVVSPPQPSPCCPHVPVG